MDVGRYTRYCFVFAKWRIEKTVVIVVVVAWAAVTHSQSHRTRAQ